MKKILSAITASFIPAVLMVQMAAGQSSLPAGQTRNDSLLLAKNERKTAAVFDVTPAGKPTTATNAGENLQLISKRALKNFTASFKTAEAVKWFTIPDGFIAYCSINHQPSKLYYDRQGNWRYTTRTYEEKELPADIRATVKRTYYDYTIYGVQEIQAADKMVYIVYLKDDNTIITLKVCEGEMEEIQHFKNTP
jgi:hypothetical protein